ncbi:MAG TPA: dihydrofolate reductase family protein, partial [Bacteroidota bacterium]
MKALTPLETLYETGVGDNLPLPDEITTLYGTLAFPPSTGRPYVISNFVSTLDGVVSLDVPGTTDGDELSGSNQHDSMVMALLRAVCDAVIVGAKSLRKSSQHIWTADHVYPELEGAFATLRSRLGKPEEPLNVFVSASGEIDPTLPVFHREDVPSLI